MPLLSDGSCQKCLRRECICPELAEIRRLRADNRELRRYISTLTGRTRAPSRARQMNCEQCDKEFYATRADTRYCSSRCRSAAAREKFKIENPPAGWVKVKSGVPGVRWHRENRSWSVRIRVAAGKWKYVGCRHTLEEAIALQKVALRGREGEMVR